MAESAREMCGSVGVEGENPNIVCWNDQVKPMVKRKECVGRQR